MWKKILKTLVFYELPADMQHGWWRIFDLAMLKSVMSCTLGRGIRERNLQRAVHRYLDYARLHCTYDSEKGEKDPLAGWSLVFLMKARF